MNAVLKPVASFTDYVIADISLAAWGRKEFKVAETEMPGLMAMRRVCCIAAPQRCAHYWLYSHDHSNWRAG